MKKTKSKKDIILCKTCGKPVKQPYQGWNLYHKGECKRIAKRKYFEEYYKLNRTKVGDLKYVRPDRIDLHTTRKRSNMEMFAGVAPLSCLIDYWHNKGKYQMLRN